MLCDDLARFGVLVEQPSHPARDRLDDRGEHAAVGELDECGMEVGVAAHRITRSSRGEVSLGRADEVVEARQAVVVEHVDEPVGEHALERLPHREEHGDVVGVQAAHDHAARGPFLEEAFALEAAQRLAHGHPGHTELLGDVTFDESCPGREGAGDDALAQRLGDRSAQRDGVLRMFLAGRH